MRRRRPVKQRRTVDNIKAHRAAGIAVLSTQVLQQHENVALQKLGLSCELIRERSMSCRRFNTVTTSADFIAGALDWHVLRGLSFYDAQIVQSAIAGGREQVPSEDLQHGAQFGGVRIVNPFLR